jgi:hypothetical protein
MILCVDPRAEGTTPLLAHLAPHQPRSARDAADAMERGGVGSGARRVQEGTAGEESAGYEAAGKEISMAESEPGTGMPHYDREFLLSPGKRNQMMALWEVQKFGTDSFRRPGLRLDLRYEARRVVHTRCATVSAHDARGGGDRLGAMIGQDVARRVAGVPTGTPFGVIDPFAGSCNGLYWVLRHVPNATALGFELDETVFALTSRNLRNV